MAVEKQPDDSKTLPDGANDWFRQFLKHLEVYMVDTGQGLAENAEPTEYSLATMRAIKLTLLDSGLVMTKFWSSLGAWHWSPRLLRSLSGRMS